MFLASWVALRGSNAPCDDGGSCFAVTVALVGLNLIGYAGALAGWFFVLRRSLVRVSPNAPRRASSALMAQVLGGGAAIVGGAALGGPWSVIGLAAALWIVPTVAAWWVASRPEVVPWWRRPPW